MKKHVLYSMLAAVLIAGIGVAVKDPWLSIVTSVCATVYMLTLSAEKRYAFLFGIAYCLTFSYIAFRGGLYATAIFFLGYLAPVLFLSFLRNANRPAKEKPPLGWRGWTAVGGLIVLLFLILFMILRLTDDAQPQLDALSFSVSAVTALLMLLKHKEFWVTNTLGCCLSIAIWSVQFVSVGNGMNLIVMQIISLLASIHGLRRNGCGHKKTGGLYAGKR